MCVISTLVSRLVGANMLRIDLVRWIADEPPRMRQDGRWR